MKFLIQIHGPWTRENKPDYINKAGTKTGKTPYPRDYDSAREAEEDALVIMHNLGGSDYTVDPA